MRYLVLFILFQFSTQLQAQTWTTLNTMQMGNAAASPGFKLDVYRNDLWYLSYDFSAPYKISCFHLSDGSVDVIDALSANSDVAFTPASRFFMSFASGLYKVNSDFTLTNKYSGDYNSALFQNGDTIYMPMAEPSGLLRYTENGWLITLPAFKLICAKDSQFYPANSTDGSLRKYTGNGASGYESYSTIDDQYICGLFNDIKFSPYSDTIYVACAAGISVGVNYDFVDSITPDNTTNMPSANVLEFEFDLENRMWACFGDVNGDAFALARLDGDTWTNYYDANNSPITFDTYKGMEIDTTGNLWVAATTKTYLLDLGETPLWLGTSELKEEFISLAPNPATEQCELSFPDAEERVVTVMTVQGQVLETHVTQTNSFSMDLTGLAKGNYLVVITSSKGKTVKPLNKL